MDQKREGESASVSNHATVERMSECELVVTRIVNGQARIVFEAWTKSELFKQWWLPKSCGLSLLSCEMDVRIGGGYQLEFGHPASGQPMKVFGRYIEVIENARIAWTNEESDHGAVTTVTFEEQGGKTMVVVRDRYPSKEALDAEIASGATGGMRETLDQLEDFIVALVKS